MAFLAKLFGKKKDNKPDEEVLTEEEGLTPEEEAAYKLGRNHRVSGKPKHASVSEYSRATGMEAIFGYLHLTMQNDRIRELIEIAYRDTFNDIKYKI